MKNGIDISEWQTGLDYTTMSKNIDFVIIREGYRKTRDKMFMTHVNGFRALGVPIIGVYHFIYALSSADAKKEAESCIANVEAAGLPKTTRIWCDFEYDSVTKAAAQGVTLGPDECDLFTRVFCEAIINAGYPTGIYANQDYCNRMYKADTLQKYPLWFAQYEGDAPKRECMLWQYGSKGNIPGYGGNLDMDYLVSEESSTLSGGDDSAATAKTVLDIARGWLGRRESDGSHKAIIDLYNSHKPLARSYAVKYTDQWCDTCLSAMFIKAGAVDLIGGTECGVEEHVKKFKAAGIWIEDGAITPQAGDIIVYNWDDSTQPNDGYSDHIGIVEGVNGKTITTIEGNYRDSVARRTITVGHGQIRGYARPKYGMVEEIVIEEPDTLTPSPEPTIGGTYMFATETVKNGSSGASAKLLQKLLRGEGYYGANGKALTLDGQAGTNTIFALRSYQRSNGLTADGICGPLTWQRILGV